MKERIQSDIKEALKAGEEIKVGTLRMVLAFLINKEKDLPAGRQGRELSDEEAMDVLQTEAKKRREAIEAFEKGGRPELAEKEKKELEILKTPPNKQENYNCFIYVLGLANDQELIKECGGFIYGTFFQKLINEGLLEYTNKPKNGDYILYRDLKNYPNMITHIGIINNHNIVTSKWAWGPLFKHKIFDVPESYGDDISYIKAISKEKAKELYKKYKEFNIKPD
ncbi:GatB/YqeY domain-containing protein [Patescibacteria group bacterium]|nr:GatB/YqeY domain-containing protein [Patescibacteria group bacterium]